MSLAERQNETSYKRYWTKKKMISTEQKHPSKWKLFEYTKDPREKKKQKNSNLAGKNILSF